MRELLGEFMSSLDDILGKVSNKASLKETIVEKLNRQDSLDDLYNLIQHEKYVGEIIDMEYEKSLVQISEHHRQKVGGLPSQGFLVATRINPLSPTLTDVPGENEYDKEDCCVILMRILNSDVLPADMERKMMRSERAESANEFSGHWEDSLDATSKKVMSFTGIRCRIIGTFYLQKEGKKLQLKFGSDVSNFYSNRGLKVYKPTNKALEAIVNFGVDKDNGIKIGKVRYVSTQRVSQGIDDVPIIINPLDLVAQKTAIFGMTRTGKSNTVKTIVKAIYQQRFAAKPQMIGQLIFDPNGEYANENLQDKNDETGEAQAIRNLYKIGCNGQVGKTDDVQIYSLSEHKNDPNRKIMKINFFDNSLIHIGKELLNNKLSSEDGSSSIYMSNFINLEFTPASDDDMAGGSRYNRQMLAYKTLLTKAGFEPPKNGQVAKFSIGKELLKALEEGIEDYENLDEKDQDKVKGKKKKYDEAFEIFTELSNSGSTYAKLSKGFEFLNDFIADAESTYASFNKKYIRTTSTSGTSWADNDLLIILNMFKYKNAATQIGKASVFHNPNSSKGDYAKMIYEDLKLGRLVIVDQALGDTQLNQIAAERIVKTIFSENAKIFSNAENPPDIIVFVEEAHNLMPKGSEENARNVWARVAKEGAKFNIGMAYSTQEVSAIQRNILKNTTNWFIAHLNNKEEVSALEMYYDFEDYSKSILKAEDKGFIRMKTRSNKYVLSIQVDKFQIN